MLLKQSKFNKADGAFYADTTAGRRVKGKQVKILHDLVTVIAERYTFRMNHQCEVTERSGRLV